MIRRRKRWIKSLKSDLEEMDKRKEGHVSCYRVVTCEPKPEELLFMLWKTLILDGSDPGTPHSAALGDGVETKGWPGD
ncbi:hypothetical protein RRG08_065800 [Elysia crispata]|uniref:Uncharacterized protein n=1 Tax=Elysia crispata TaxID=231223 RepID=A0AAE0ZSC6_9GAST|nr:hypothetical protein RRG08_065800 [Elysia crispata]